MTRSRSSRLPALFTAVILLLLGAGDVFGLHSCPHHERGAAEHEQQVDGGAAHHAAAGHDDGTEVPAGDVDHTGGPCICGGSCPAVSLVTLPGMSISIAEIFPTVVQQPGIRASVAPRTYHLPFFLPYAQAPPLAG